jgi:hypothetical protein
MHIPIQLLWKWCIASAYYFRRVAFIFWPAVDFFPGLCRSGNVTRSVSKPHGRNLFLQSLVEEGQNPSTSNGASNSQKNVEDKDLLDCLENGVNFWMDGGSQPPWPLAMEVAGRRGADGGYGVRSCVAVCSPKLLFSCLVVCSVSPKLQQQQFSCLFSTLGCALSWNNILLRLHCVNLDWDWFGCMTHICCNLNEWINQ